MIIYHPYKDANHCAYRIISLMFAIDGYVSANFLHFADFYYLFPSELKFIHNWPRKNSADYKLINLIEKCYEEIPNPRMIFFEMKEIRNNALINLVSRGIVHKDPSSESNFSLNKETLPDSFVQILKNDDFRNSSIFKLIVKELSQMPMNGANGLKAKSNLMEYRYD